jgi:putative transposase
MTKKTPKPELRCFKVELDPTVKQRVDFARHAGAARFAYNWGLETAQEEYKKNKKTLSAIDLHKRLVILKHTPESNGGLPWLKDVSKWVPSQALRNLEGAFKKFFDNLKKGKKPGFPKFKSKHKSKKSFALYERVSFSKDFKKIKVPVIGYIKLKETDYIPSNCKLKSCVISEQSGRWFISVTTDIEVPKPPVKIPQVTQTNYKELIDKEEIIGLDVGIKTLLSLSNGKTYDNPKAYAGARTKLRHLQRDLSRKKLGSNNRGKAILRLQKQHYHIACIRRDTIHKMTSEIIAMPASVLGVETLNVKGMVKNHRLAASVSDAAFGEILRQLEYKCIRAGKKLVKADRFYPSSKTCSGCGALKDSLTLDERVYSCVSCGLLLDRDLNAARNLAFYAANSVIRETGGSSDSLNVPVEGM